jgi:hypothetical protein
MSRIGPGLQLTQRHMNLHLTTLASLGLEISERTVSRYLPRLGRPGNSAKRWLIFLKNHREVMAAMDFFTVPTATFRMLCGFFVIGHERRRICRIAVGQHEEEL